jgi:predicted transcriptional regulator
MSEDHDNYWQTVHDVAESILAELEDTDEDRDEVLTRLVDEYTDQHDYVVQDDLQIHTLQHSDNPCAAIFNGTVLSNRYQSGDNFPFAAFAADAFAADVASKVKGMLS